MVEITVLEKKPDMLVIELTGRNHLTLANALNENLWQQKGVSAAFSQKHPQIPKTELVVRASSPKAKLMDAAEQLEKDAQSLMKQIK